MVKTDNNEHKIGIGIPPGHGAHVTRHTSHVTKMKIYVTKTISHETYRTVNMLSI